MQRHISADGKTKQKHIVYTVFVVNLTTMWTRKVTWPHVVYLITTTLKQQPNTFLWHNGCMSLLGIARLCSKFCLLV